VSLFNIHIYDILGDWMNELGNASKRKNDFKYFRTCRSPNYISIK